MGGEKTEALGRTKTSGSITLFAWLTDKTPVVEDDQDIGESNASVTINIGGAVILTEIKVRHCSNGIIDVVVPITVDITIHVGIHDSASAEPVQSCWDHRDSCQRSLLSHHHRCQCLRSRIHTRRACLGWISRATIVAVSDTIFVTVEIFYPAPAVAGSVLLGSSGQPSTQSSTPPSVSGQSGLP